MGGQTITGTDTLTSSVTGTSDPAGSSVVAVPILSDFTFVLVAMLLILTGLWTIRARRQF